MAARVSDGDLLEEAKAALRAAYAPYSNFKVGCALLTRDGRVFRGANVENASYGASVCAERVALFKAVSEGERDFVRLALVGAKGQKLLPCGICRQVLGEFAADLDVLLQNRGKAERKKLSKLYPDPFQMR